MCVLGLGVAALVIVNGTMNEACEHGPRAVACRLPESELLHIDSEGPARGSFQQLIANVGSGAGGSAGGARIITGTGALVTSQPQFVDVPPAAIFTTVPQMTSA
jgi:hypothetical protein